MKQRVILSFLFALLFAAKAFANEEYYKEFRKSISVPANVTLDLQVNFSDVTITTWDQPTMEIVVKMDLNVKSQERADAIANAVFVNEKPDWIRLNIDIPGGKTWTMGKNETTTITAEIKMPASGNLSGQVGFGDLVITDLLGVCQLVTNYGDFVANSLGNSNNTLKHDFGDLIVKKLGGGTVNAGYGDVRIEELTGKAEFKHDFGDLKIQSVNKSCTRVVVNGSYGDVAISLSKTTGANFDLRTDFGNVKVDSSAKKSQSKTDFNSETIQGSLGNGDCQVIVSNSFGDIKLNYAN